MDVADIKKDKSLIDQGIELSGKLADSSPTEGGFWLDVRDKTDSIFVFSKNNFDINDTLKIKGFVKLDENNKVNIHARKVIRVVTEEEVPEEEAPKEIKKSPEKPKSKLNITLLVIIGLVVLIVIVTLLIIFYGKGGEEEEKSEIESFLESVNKDFTATLNSCIKTRNSEERDRCLYRAAPYAVKENVTLAIDICKRIEDSSEVIRCINFLSSYMVKKDMNSSIDICNSMEDITSKNDCILGLIPDLVQQDINRTLELCKQFDIKDNCFYNIALSYTDIEEGKVYCEKILDSTIKDSCFTSFEQRDIPTI